MPYHQFTITCPEQYGEQLTHALMELGSLGIIDEGTSLIAYFPSGMDRGVIGSQLDIFLTLLRSSDNGADLSYTYAALPDADWNESWKKNFTPIDLGDRFTVLPPWELYRGDRIPLVIDPGMAFGTGHHGTTRSCLALMDRYAGSAGKGRFLDLGTGTGLLAIAAIKLGFTDVVGVDTDPLALEAARRNLELNGVRTVRLIEGSLEAADGLFDMIAANLISGTLIELAGGIARHLQPAGIAILSGILEGQDDEVAGSMERAGLRCRERLRDGKWVSLTCWR
jgi:ribosomal protein L11 methyltransferase